MKHFYRPVRWNEPPGERPIAAMLMATMTDAAQLNAEQLDYWDGAGGERWVAQQPRRDALLSQFGAVALAKARVQPGERVVDVGCGCGETTALLAQAVGVHGRVLAVDISRPILAQARARLSELDNVEIRHADAAAYAFPRGEADLLFSRFGVMFFGDPAGAFANLRKALKPGGRLVFACWRGGAENLWMTAPWDAVKSLLPPAPRPDPEQPGPMSFGDPARVTRILTAAGFTPPTFETFDTLMDVAEGGGVEGAVQSAIELGPTARALDGQSDDLRLSVAQGLRDFFGSKIDADGAANFPAAVWIVSAEVAAA